jgi:hypothetical protein
MNYFCANLMNFAKLLQRISRKLHKISNLYSIIDQFSNADRYATDENPENAMQFASNCACSSCGEAQVWCQPTHKRVPSESVEK